MKDMPTTLRRLDEEIVGHHQNIARSQVAIMRLQDTRKLLMGLAEDDQAALERDKLERAGVIAGAHASPQLIVRKTGTGDHFGGEDGSASHAAKTGLKVAAKRTTRDYKVDSAKYGRRTMPNQSGLFRAKILKLLEPDAQMTSQQIGDHLGLKRDQDVRKPMSNALYQMLQKGTLARDEDKNYRLAEVPPT